MATKLAIANNKDAFVVGFDDGHLLFGSLCDEKRNFSIQEFCHTIAYISFSRDSNLVIASEEGGKVIVWDVAKNTIVDILHHEETVSECDIISKGYYVTVDISQIARIWKYNEANTLINVMVDLSDIHELGNSVEGCKVKHRTNEVVFLIDFDWVTWDIAKECPKKYFDGIEGWYQGRLDGDLEFSNNGEYLIIYWDDGFVFNTTTGILVKRFDRELPPVSIKLSDSGELFGIGAREGWVAVQDINKGYILKEKVSEHKIVSIDMTNDGKLISFVDKVGYCGIIDVKTGEMLISSEIINTMI